MRTEEHVAHLAAEAGRFADLVEATAAERPIVTCPGWTVRDLALHVGGLYAWSTRLLAGPVVVETWRSEMTIDYPGPAEPLAPWLRTNAADLIAMATTTDPATPVWSWANDHHARAWPRRMLFETVVHRLDLVRNRDVTGEDAHWEIDPAVAVEGIDEFFEVLPFFTRWGDQLDALRSPVERTIGLRAPSASWRVTLRPSGWFWDRGSAPADVPADVTVSGDTTALLAFLYQRSTAGITVDGDGELVARWLTATHF